MASTHINRTVCALKSREEAAAYLGISTRTLSRRVDDGVLPVVRTCRHGRMQFRQKDLDDYIKKHTHVGRRCG